MKHSFALETDVGKPPSEWIFETCVLPSDNLMYLASSYELAKIIMEHIAPEEDESWKNDQG
jgi:hypothetical protein